MSITIKSGATSDEATVDPTSKAVRVTLYDTAGVAQSPRRTYRATTAVALVAANGTAPFIAVYGSATTVVRIKTIIISGYTLTAAEYIGTRVAKYSTAITGGTATALVQTPLDASDAAATLSICNSYTVAPTAGTKIGDVAARRSLGQATVAVAAGIPNDIEIQFDQYDQEGLVLRGTAQGIGIYFAAAPASAVTTAVMIEWSEE